MIERQRSLSLLDAYSIRSAFAMDFSGSEICYLNRDIGRHMRTGVKSKGLRRVWRACW